MTLRDKVAVVTGARYERPIGEKKRQVGLAAPAGRMGDPDDYQAPRFFWLRATRTTW